MNRTIKYPIIFSLLLLSNTLSATEFGVTAGVQDFMVSNIANDVVLDAIDTDTSHIR